MPAVSLSNNQLLPANQRASDVAAQAVEGIVPIQQQRVDAAFRVQGFQAIIYHYLSNGRKCSCQAHGHKLNARLGQDGNADSGLINQLITGQTFGTQDYTLTSQQFESHIMYSGIDPSSSQLPELWNKVEADPEDTQLGDNGITGPSLEPMFNGFDQTSLLFGDTACPVCFGTGFIGGYSIYNGIRNVVPVEEMELGLDGVLNVEEYPYSANSTYFEFNLKLPKDIVTLDCFRLKYKFETLNPQLFIDGQPLTQNLLRFKCDGHNHLISGKFNESIKFTHFEFQANLSSKSAFVEFPRLTKGSRIDVLDSTEDFQLLLSPDVPHIQRRDLIADSVHKKIFYVQNTSLLNTRERQMLGWELNVRVIQPQEVLSNLPLRKPMRTRGQTVNPVIGNIGNRP